MNDVLCDHNFNQRIAEAVQRLLPDVRIELARRFGLQRIPDVQLLGYAADFGFTVLSHDTATFQPAIDQRFALGLSVPRVILVPQWLGIGRAADEIALLLAAGTDAD